MSLRQTWNSSSAWEQSDLLRPRPRSPRKARRILKTEKESSGVGKAPFESFWKRLSDPHSGMVLEAQQVAEEEVNSICVGFK